MSSLYLLLKRSLCAHTTPHLVNFCFNILSPVYKMYLNTAFQNIAVTVANDGFVLPSRINPFS